MYTIISRQRWHANTSSYLIAFETKFENADSSLKIVKLGYSLISVCMLYITATPAGSTSFLRFHPAAYSVQKSGIYLFATSSSRSIRWIRFIELGSNSNNSIFRCFAWFWALALRLPQYHRNESTNKLLPSLSATFFLSLLYPITGWEVAKKPRSCFFVVILCRQKS